MNYHLLNTLLDFPKNTGERTQVILDSMIFSYLSENHIDLLLRPRRKYIIPMLLALLKMTTGQFIR